MSTSLGAGCGSRQKLAWGAREQNLLLTQTDDMAWAGGGENMHVLNLAGAVGSEERGGNAGDRMCVGEEVGGFHTQPIQSDNVVTTSL